MANGVKFLGHPIHPMLIPFPVGLLSSAVIFDLARIGTGDPSWGHFAFRLIVIGVLGGLVAAVFGLIDWLAIPRGTRAWRIGLVHGVGNVVMVGLFALSGYLRFGVAEAPPTNATVLALIGVGFMLVTGWLGGELVDRLGVGVDEGANLNASNSLTGAYPRKPGSHSPLPTPRPVG